MLYLANKNIHHIKELIPFHLNETDRYMGKSISEKKKDKIISFTLLNSTNI